MKIQILFFTYLRGQKVGEDAFGNVYYKTSPFWSKLLQRFGKQKKERRWVIYKGTIEGSKVPAKWFGWLHFSSDAPLEELAYSWEKPHMPNLTGTKTAYKYPDDIKNIPKMHVNGVKSWKPD